MEWIMRFQYDELKEGIEDDFKRFSEWEFNEQEIFLAVLDEYQYGKDYSLMENVCINIFLALLYKKNKMNYDLILTELNKLIRLMGQDAIKDELGKDFDKFRTDYNAIICC